MFEELETAGSVIGLLVFMLLLFAGAYYAAKIIGGQYGGRAVSTKNIEIVDKLALAHDRFLVILRTGGKTLLLGVTPQHIETLTELDSAAFADLPKGQESTDFLRILKSRLGKPENREE